MRRKYPQDPENYMIASCWQEIDKINEDVSRLNNVTLCDNNMKKMSPDAARLIMDNQLIIRQLLDIMIRTIQSQLR